MNFGEVKSRVRDCIAALSTEVEAQIETFIEDTVLEIGSYGPFPWDKKASTFLARGPLDITATWTLGNSTLTVNSGQPATQAIANDYMNGLIKINGGNIYEISNWVVASSTITVVGEILEASGVAAGCQIIADMVSLPTTVESVIEISDPVYGFPLIDRAGLGQRRWPDPFNVLGGYPRFWWNRGVDSENRVEVVLHPPPNESRMYSYGYFARVSFDPAAADAVEMEVMTRIPAKWHTLIVAGAKYRAFEFEFESEAQKNAPYGEFLRGIMEIKKCRLDPGAVQRLRSPRRPRMNPFGRQTAYWPTDRIDGV